MPDDNLTITIVGGLAAWAITGILSFSYKRYYLRAAVARDIQRQQRRIAKQEEYLRTFAESSFIEGSVLGIGSNYERTDHSVYRELISQLVHYSPAPLEKVIQFYEAIREVDSLFDSLWADVRRDKEGKERLSSVRVKYYDVKSQRIYRFCEAITSFDGTLRKLPSSYDVPDSVEMLKLVRNTYAENGSRLTRSRDRSRRRQRRLKSEPGFCPLLC